MEIAHESLHVYHTALGVAQWAAGQAIPAYRKHFRDQLLRAADSVVLNIAEGAGYEPGVSRRHHFRIAAASAAEVAACLDLLALAGGAERKAELRIVIGSLHKLVRR